MSIFDQIDELRAELAGCVLAKVARAAIEAELAALIAKQTALKVEPDDLFDITSEAPAES